MQWRADETALVSAAPVKPGGTLTVAPELDDRWWARLTSWLDVLQGASTTRVATVHTELMTQERITATIRGVFGDQVDTTVTQWAPAHADLNWANLTAPECWILDWEDGAWLRRVWTPRSCGWPRSRCPRWRSGSPASSTTTWRRGRGWWRHCSLAAA